MRIYFDHNAGAPLRPAARDAMVRLMTSHSEGNPASVHVSGQRARRLLEQSRTAIAEAIGASRGTMVFTSGGTESNNLAIFGTMQDSAGRRRIVTSTIEHSSVLGPIAELERRGFEVVRVGVDSAGRIASVAELIDGDTALVTIGIANAEVGTIQDL
ncbi:MAG: aminotransferase class V-fold PLP-dependent enzyme, partial [Bryobacterales bacterium]|nr:aminotransferase class V-fold PLP-dependent enzyme [Bryobacterales bacterium]